MIMVINLLLMVGNASGSIETLNSTQNILDFLINISRGFLM
jgi:hypothetical protein